MQLTFRRFDLQLTHTWRISSAAGKTLFPVLFVELSHADGRTGIGEAAPSDRYDEDVESAQRFLLRVDSRMLSFDDVQKSMEYLNSLAPRDFAAKCALNIALLDGAARAEQTPLYDHLNLGFTENKHRTSFSIGIDTPDAIRRKVIEAEQYPVLKLKLGSADDEASLAALRSVAPAKPVRVDANEAWPTREEALRKIEWLQRDGHIQFIEQPMPSNSKPADMVWLKSRSALPIYADESYECSADISRAAECFHGVNVKLVKAGGITGAYDALRTARKAGLKTMIGCMIESSMLITAAAHLVELADDLDLDGNLLISNDPCQGVTTERGLLSFKNTPEEFGLRVRQRQS
jgi:L-alanine-DL-glutamate epimerase-like enolase superfamily enzyme